MHVHANQINASAQTDALYAAERAAAKRAAEGTRKKLLEFASEMAGEAESGEACVVRLGSREDSGEQAKQEDQQSEDKRKKAKTGEAENSDSSISDWA